MVRRTKEEVEIDKAIASGSYLDNLQRVDVKVAKDARVVFSVRISMEEMEIISRAANGQGMKAGDFIRSSALEKALAAEQDSSAYDLAAIKADIARISRKLDQASKRQSA